jgi:hypothetical protein
MKIRFLFLLGLLASAVSANKLSTPFADVQVKGVQVGKPFFVTHSAGDGLILQNGASWPVNVRVDVVQPGTTDLRGGAEAIPDIRWVKVTPNQVDIPANSRAMCRVEITVPEKKIYRNKHYQVMLWSRSQPKGSQHVSIGAGLISRLRFTTE